MSAKQATVDDQEDDLPPDLDDPEAAALAANLRYVHDNEPGFTRRMEGEHWAFYDTKKRRISDEATIQRIRKLAIPPAYTEVWICRHANGHLQAVGRDVRGRKQYRYHPRWREVRDEAKYGRMLVFGRVLPKIRAQADHDLALPGLPRAKVLATLVKLLERTLVRVGNEEYARTNDSFGLTTLRRQHAQVSGSRVTFDFRAKHGIQAHVALQDRRLAKIIARLQDVPGQELFQYVDADGTRHSVGSNDVNQYLHEVSGEEITAKDFRTWAATNLAALALTTLEAFDSQVKAKKNVLRAIEGVSKMLGNTPAVCRKCYIHPAIFDGYLDGSLLEGLKVRAEAKLHDPASGLTAEEVGVMAFLSEKLANAVSA